MRKFSGFPPGPARLIELPAQFFSELLPLIDDLDELRVTLYAMWAFQQKDGDFRYLRLQDFTGLAAPMHGLEGDKLERAIQRAVTRGTLLAADVMIGDKQETLYFANSASGRTAVRQIETNNWLPSDAANPVQILPERPTVYKLYEENIGALTPLIADDLKDTEAEYGYDLLSEAIEISVRQEKRSMAYIQAILARWKKEGKHRDIHRRLVEEDGERYVSGEFSDFIKR